MNFSRLVSAARRLAVLGGTLLAVIMSSTGFAFADIGDKGSPEPLSAAAKFAYFVGIPVLLLVIFLAIFMRPGSGGATRYRPTRGWDAEEATFGLSTQASETAVAADDESGGSRGSW